MQNWVDYVVVVLVHSLFYAVVHVFVVAFVHSMVVHAVVADQVVYETETARVHVYDVQATVVMQDVVSGIVVVAVAVFCYGCYGDI